MKMTLPLKAGKVWAAGALFLFATGMVSAQTPSDAVMMKSGEICAGLFYNNSAWSEYWEGDSLRDNENIGTLTTHVYSAGFQLGIVDRVNFFASLPFVVTSPSAGEVIGEHGIQDVAFFVKGSIMDKEMGPGHLKLLATAGLSMPASDYIPEAAYPIGIGCVDGSLRGIVHYDANANWYARVDGAYHLRGTSAIVRTYYYTTEAYTSNEIEMPQAMDLHVTAGWWSGNKKFKGELQYTMFNTLGGFDIRRQDGGFPSNEIDFQRFGVNLSYYDLGFKGTGIYLNSAITPFGRNTGKSFLIGGGISYQFNVWGGNKSSEDTSK